MFHRLIALTYCLICSVMQVQAQEHTQTFTSPPHQTAMLELYTSQGCSSCPPAERWLSGFTESPKLWRDIIPINFRVDYWDYLGWKDHYANPVFSSRQRLYQTLGHARTVATPGFIINGRGWNGWFYNQPIRAENLNNAGVLSVDVQGREVTIRFLSPSLNIHALKAHAVVMGFGLKDEITRGENRGKTFVQDFVVLTYDQGELTVNDALSATPAPSTAPLEESPLMLRIKTPDVSSYQTEKLAIAVWISEANDPAPIQAVGGWLDGPINKSN